MDINFSFFISVNDIHTKMNLSCNMENSFVAKVFSWMFL